jgi:cytochrome P450
VPGAVRGRAGAEPRCDTRLRGLVNKVFTARKIEEMRPGIQAITDRLLDKVAGAGEMDAIRDLAFPLPVLVICELLGIPEEDRARFVNATASGAALLNPVPPTREELDRANEARSRPARISKRCSSSGGSSRATIC